MLNLIKKIHRNGTRYNLKFKRYTALYTYRYDLIKQQIKEQNCS